MTGADVKRIRLALEEAAGGRLTQRGLGLLLGLAEKNAADTVRKWEDSAPSGPAATALSLMADILLCQDRALRNGLLKRVREKMLG